MSGKPHHDDLANSIKYDTALMRIVDDNRGLEGFFDAVLGFLGRGTDFFTREQQAFETVNGSMTKHIAIFRDNKKVQIAIEKKQREQQEEARVERESQMAAMKAKIEKTTGQTADVMEVTNEEAEKIKKEEAAKKAATEAGKETADGADGEGEEDSKPKGQKPNAGNGGNTETYHWEQTLNDVTCYYYLPDGCKAKDLKIDMSIKGCKLAIKGEEKINEPWHAAIKLDDSLWCIEADQDGRRCLQLSLTKLKGQCWWTSVWESSDRIDTGGVAPANSKLGDLDGETRGVVEKMMFDQQQKQKGQPTSDELQKKDKLKAFMDQHPEMDFSKTKFS